MMPWPMGSSAWALLLGCLLLACQLPASSAQIPFMVAFRVRVKEGEGSVEIAKKLSTGINTEGSLIAHLMPRAFARVENSSFPPLRDTEAEPAPPAAAPAPAPVAPLPPPPPPTPAPPPPPPPPPVVVGAPAPGGAPGPAPGPWPVSAPAPIGLPSGFAARPAPAHMSPPPALAPAPAPAPRPAPGPAPGPAPAPLPVSVPAPAPAPAGKTLMQAIAEASLLVHQADDLSRQNFVAYGRLRSRIQDAATSRKRALHLGPDQGGSIPPFWAPTTTMKPPEPPISVARLVYDAIVNTPPPEPMPGAPGDLVDR
mmetsp:Transcript_53929/g.175399  ORF Transcript_53929/g.175399 Transcript_53929/m.175399 type:complete len:311 (-) Transcript_53929:57-989(-)